MSNYLVEQYQRFRASHDCKVLVRGEARWEYIVSGHGDSTVLLLPGALGMAETSFEYILAFEPDYRIISISYPSTVRLVEEAVDGVIGILDSQSAPNAFVIAGSYSGFIAQVLVRAHPQRVRALVLSGAGVPRPDRVARSRVLMRGASLKPWSAMKAMLHLANHIALPRRTPETDFWRGYFDATIECITPQDLISRLELAVDFDSHYTFRPSDLDGWGGRMLIVEAGGDQFFPAAERLALRALYPAAEIHTFEKDAHSGTLVRGQEYAALYRAFLENALDGSDGEAVS